MPQSLSYRWCKELHKALQPLLQFKLLDGSNALLVYISSSTKHYVCLNKSFEKKNWKSIDIRGKLVCEIKTMITEEMYSDHIYFYHKDFLGDAQSAKEKFAEVVAHLKEHAVPHIAPKWINSVMKTLQK